MVPIESIKNAKERNNEKKGDSNICAKASAQSARMKRPYAKRVRGRNKKERKVKSEKRKQDSGKKIDRKREKEKENEEPWGRLHRGTNDDAKKKRCYIVIKKNPIIISFYANV